METKFTTSLVERLKLMERFSQIVPQTMEGKTIYERYAKMFEQSGASVSGFHNFMLECLQTQDQVMKNWAQTQSNRISLSDPNGWYFNLVMEKLSISGQSLNEAIVDDLKYLQAFNESDLSEAIANGALSKNLMVPELKILQERITGVIGARKLMENNIMYTPISYIESRGGSKFMMIEGRIYEDSETGLVETQAPSAEFSQVNAAIQTIPYNPDVDEFELTFLPGAVNVTSGGEILKDKEPWTIQQLQDAITEACKDKPAEVQLQESRKFDALNTIMEHWDQIYKLDNVTAVKNTISGNCAYLVEHANMNYVITKTGIQSSSKSLNESISAFNKFVGINLRGMFRDKLNEEFKVQNQKLTISESLEKDIQKYQNVINSCNEELAYIAEGSEKERELKAIMEDAKQVIGVLRDTQKKL